MVKVSIYVGDRRALEGLREGKIEVEKEMDCTKGLLWTV